MSSEIQKPINQNYLNSYSMQLKILNDEVSDQEMINLFQQQSQKGIIKEEFLGFYEASLRFQITDKLDLELTNQNTIDIVGTGGDGLNTINISTISAYFTLTNGLSSRKAW